LHMPLRCASLSPNATRVLCERNEFQTPLPQTGAGAAARAKLQALARSSRTGSI
jgi:hypothetical protein